MQHHEWLAGRIASMKEQPKKVLTPFEEAKEKFEIAKERLQQQSKVRTRPKVIAALEDCYRKGTTPATMDHDEKHAEGNEWHPHSDHVQRLKHGGAFTTV